MVYPGPGKHLAVSRDSGKEAYRDSQLSTETLLMTGSLGLAYALTSRPHHAHRHPVWERWYLEGPGGMFFQTQNTPKDVASGKAVS